MSEWCGAWGDRLLGRTSPEQGRRVWTGLEINISPQGEVTVQTKGYAGSSCQAATKALEEALGLKAKEKLTAEYYQAQTTQSQQRLQQ